MLLEGVGEAIEQLLTMLAVVGLVQRQRVESLAPSQLIQPLPSPGTVVEHTMEIGADHVAASRCGLPPAKPLGVGQGLQLRSGFGGSVVEFKATDGGC